MSSSLSWVSLQVAVLPELHFADNILVRVLQRRGRRATGAVPVSTPVARISPLDLQTLGMTQFPIGQPKVQIGRAVGRRGLGGVRGGWTAVGEDGRLNERQILVLVRLHEGGFLQRKKQKKM